MVRAGSYDENIDFSKGGATGAPSILKSADGVGAAVIKPADPSQDTIQIDGHDHIAIDGFELHGSSDVSRQVIHIHAVEGNTNPASHIMISNNVIVRGEGDGIKVSKSTDVSITNNVIKGGGEKESAIDIVGGARAVIDGNVITDTPKIGIMVKGGSKDIAITNNQISNIGGNAIEVGGYIEVLRPFPGLPSGVFAGGGLEVRTGVDGGHDGTLIIPKAGIRSIRDGRILSADLAFTFTDDNYADTFFSTPGFEAEGGLQDIVLTLFGSVPVTENVSLQGVLGLNFYQGDAADSPITEEDGDVFFGFGATYSF